MGFLASCQERGGYFVVFRFSDVLASLLLLIMYIIAGTYEGIDRYHFYLHSVLLGIVVSGLGQSI